MERRKVALRGRKSIIIIVPTRKIGNMTLQIDDESIPENFVCPLTLELMTDPLVSKHGHSFERTAVLKWLEKGNTTCPITRQPLTMSMLIPNVSLRLRIRAWKSANEADQIFDDVVGMTEDETAEMYR